jgi:type I restriction enzyme S subunit
MLREDINGMDSGSAIPSTSRDAFYKLLVTEPPLSIQHQFVEILTPIWNRQRANDSESETLSALRDALLPKLLSGEIRVRDLETSVQ